MTIQQPVRKLRAIDGTIIAGVSGPFGLSQAYLPEIERLSKAGRFTKAPGQALKDIREAIWPRCQKEWEAATVVSKAIGNIATQSAFAQLIVAIPIYDEASLFQFDHQCSPEEATSDLPFVSIGSGRGLADPFLAFLRRVYWPSKLPILADDVFATIWTLDQAIKTNTGGVSEPIQVMTLSRDGSTGKWKVAEIDDFQEHKQNISEAEQALANYKKEQTSEGGAAPPPPPDPDPE
jgi:hypothetical protein